MPASGVGDPSVHGIDRPLVGLRVDRDDARSVGREPRAHGSLGRDRPGRSLRAGRARTARGPWPGVVAETRSRLPSGNQRALRYLKSLSWIVFDSPGPTGSRMRRFLSRSTCTTHFLSGERSCIRIPAVPEAHGRGRAVGLAHVDAAGGARRGAALEKSRSWPSADSATPSEKSSHVRLTSRVAPGGRHIIVSGQSSLRARTRPSRAMSSTISSCGVSRHEAVDAGHGDGVAARRRRC